MTNVYAVIASCTPWIVMSRSATMWAIDTFMTVLSSTTTNCADPRTVIGNPRDADAACRTRASRRAAVLIARCLCVVANDDDRSPPIVQQPA